MGIKPPSLISIHAVQTYISDLAIGMYVSHLDRDWIETPFIYQGFMIESITDINTLEEYCEYVWVEPYRGEKNSLHKLELLNPLNTPSYYVAKLTVSQEYRNSKNIFQESRMVTNTLLNDIKLSGTINIKEAKKTVATCLDSILRNESAMLWMSKVRNNDEYTAEHCLNVCILAITFGRQLELDKEELSALGLCGLLHDVGKMRVPPEILNKPGKLSPKEWKIMKGHAHFGRNLLMKAKDLGQTLDVAYGHHERIDGKGYPQGVRGDKISRYAKIIAIVDAFDAMTAERCYSKAMTPTAAVKIIYQEKGTHFDEHLALQFIKTIGLYPPGTIVELSNGLLAIVIERHHRYRHLPKVLLIAYQQKKLDEHKLVDLALIEKGKLGREYLIKTDHPDGYSDITIKDYQDYLLASQ